MSIFIDEAVARERLGAPINLFSPSFSHPLPPSTSSPHRSEDDGVDIRDQDREDGSHIDSNTDDKSIDSTLDNLLNPHPKNRSASTRHRHNQPRKDDDIILPCLDHPDALKTLEQIIATGSGARDGRSHYVGNREAQKAIGEVDALLGPTAASGIFGNTPPQAQAYGDGLQTPSRILDKQIKEVYEHVNLVKLSIARSASLKLKKIVDCINDERIEEIQSPVVLARLGKDVASIVERVSPRDAREEDRSIFHIYRPEVATNDQYNIVNVSIAPPSYQAPSSDGLVIDAGSTGERK